MMLEFYLLIDDVRSIDNMDQTVRTSIEGREVLLTKKVTHLLLDNDLGSDQDMEGWEILRWAIGVDCVPPKIFIVSANPVAKKRLEDMLANDLEYVRNVRGWWAKK